MEAKKSQPSAKDPKANQKSQQQKRQSVMPPNTREMKGPTSSSPSKKLKAGAANQPVGGLTSQRATLKGDKLNASLGGKGGPLNSSHGDSKRPSTGLKINISSAASKVSETAAGGEPVSQMHITQSSNTERIPATISNPKATFVERPNEQLSTENGMPASQSVLIPDSGNANTGQASGPSPGFASFLKPPTATKEVVTGNVKVFCRFRPLNQRELETTDNQLCVTFKNELTCAVQGINKATGSTELIDYTFDRTFDTNANQEEIYDSAVLPIVESCLEGYNGTIFAYGQTSSGKTHTMLGPDIDNDFEKGIIPRMVGGFFNRIESAPEEIEFTVKVSFIEIYNEKIRDLLDPKKNNLKIHENKQAGVYVQDMTESYVGGEDEVFSLLKIGNENRSIGCTDMNKQSSRSHSCFILQIEQKNTNDFSAKTGKIYLVDLAGSERISKTGAQGETLKEAKNINKSLTTLGLVINALTDGKSTHVPYRDSKLTRILQESLGGNSKTSLIVTCSPSIFNDKETISTLRFGQRAKQIKNNAKVNKEFSIQELKHMLQVAEKELMIKTKKIDALESYIEQLKSSGKVGDDDLALIQSKVNEEQKKIEKAFNNTDNAEEQKLEESQMYESDSSVSEPDEASPYPGGAPLATDLVPSPFMKGSIASEGDQLDPAFLQTEFVPKSEEELNQQIQKGVAEREQRELEKLQELRKEEEARQLKLEEARKEEEALNNQVIDEEALIDNNGEYIIFSKSAGNAGNSAQARLDGNSQDQNERALGDASAQINALQTSASGFDPTTSNGKSDFLFEENFSKLNYVNKINILLKALMIERNKNDENQIKIAVMTREYTNKVKCIATINGENEELIEKVAQSEIGNEQKEDEINILKQKHMEQKLNIEQFVEKNKSLEEILEKSEASKVDQIKQIEDRIETRVKKIIEQKQEIMKQEKKMILDKYKQYEKKIKDQRQQLKEAHSIIQKQKQIGQDERGDNFQSTLSKLINSEKNLDQLKLMYHQLASSKEVLKKDLVVLEKKYKRSQQKIKAYDNEVKQTRQQVSVFKLKFKTLTEFINKKGGLKTLNSLPNAPGYESASKHDMQSTSPNRDMNMDPLDSSRGAVDLNASTMKKSIRGGQPSINPSATQDGKTRIRGGGGRNQSIIINPNPNMSGVSQSNIRDPMLNQSANPQDQKKDNISEAGSGSHPQM